MSVILGLDPGPTESGFCVFDGKRVLRAGVRANAEMLSVLRAEPSDSTVQLAIEMMSSMGMVVGREVFESLVWIGRFQQAWHDPDAVRLVYRIDVKLHLCGSARAKDQNIRQALIDLLGDPGVKSSPGPTYGVKSHAWAALAVAVTAHAQMSPLEAPLHGLFAPRREVADVF